MNFKLVVGLSGASGLPFGIRLLQACRELNVETHLIMTKWAQKNIELETNLSPEEVISLAAKHYDNDNLGAAVSSGSFKHNGMVVIPCSMKSVSAIANGYSENLLHRAADVTIKEGRKLVVVPRETPLSTIHLENLLKLARAGVVIMPPVPAFYTCPENLNDIINHFVGRVLDQFDIEHRLSKRWAGQSGHNNPCPGRT